MSKEITIELKNESTKSSTGRASYERPYFVFEMGIHSI